ncbi:hypothetical protein GWK47_024057 [Chionoecetes opilio]|uniref:Uncharacterized protein n=1 Tax=Chionoecetes opilio TaxID=41210 RepID=A0A8J4XNS4_CHIOP|nr:hypothetical protein GWK47_024057 [Chionoecetes opilio]
MKPLANCLDRLQTEENAYLGVLLPTLTLMRVALERMEEARGDQALTTPSPWCAPSCDPEGNKGGFNKQSCVTQPRDQEDDLEEGHQEGAAGLEEEQGGNTEEVAFPAKYRDQWVTLFIK